MSTEDQIIANRRNAKKSTGPRTRAGKAAASKNSVKHGLLARQNVISSENQADFCLERDRILSELVPDSPMESMLAERIVILSWRLIRVDRIQNQTIDALSARNTSSPLAKLTKSLLFKGQAPAAGRFVRPGSRSGPWPFGYKGFLEFKGARPPPDV